MLHSTLKWNLNKSGRCINSTSCNTTPSFYSKGVHTMTAVHTPHLSRDRLQYAFTAFSFSSFSLLPSRLFLSHNWPSNSLTDIRQREDGERQGPPAYTPTMPLCTQHAVGSSEGIVLIENLWGGKNKTKESASSGRWICRRVCVSVDSKGSVPPRFLFEQNLASSDHCIVKFRIFISIFIQMGVFINVEAYLINCVSYLYIGI